MNSKSVFNNVFIQSVFYKSIFSESIVMRIDVLLQRIIRDFSMP